MVATLSPAYYDASFPSIRGTELVDRQYPTPQILPAHRCPLLRLPKFRLLPSRPVVTRVLAGGTIRGQMSHDLDYDEVTRYPHRSSPPQEEADVSEIHSTPVPPVTAVNQSAYHDASSQSIKEIKPAYPYRPRDSKPLPALPSLQISTSSTPYVQILFCLATHDS